MPEHFLNDFVSILSWKMSIVTLSEALISRLTATDGRILRDRTLCGLCLKLNKRTKTFLVATSCKGRQVRVTLGRWPLLSVDEARSRAMDILRDCRNGVTPTRVIAPVLPTVHDAMINYAKAKKLKESSLRRYQSILRTHFADWINRPINSLYEPGFVEHCTTFGSSQGSAIVSVGRGFINSLIKYVNAVYDQRIISPFPSLAAAGLLPPQPKPRARKLKESELPVWNAAIHTLPDLQRDYLLLLALTGLRRNEGSGIKRQNVDLKRGVLHIPDTKTNKPHSLPITAVVKEIFERRLAATTKDDIFHGLSAEHVAEMAIRAGAPGFTLHDLRKLLATTGERLAIGDALLRRILNHTAPRSDVLYRHYVSLGIDDILEPLTAIQIELKRLMTPPNKKSSDALDATSVENLSR